MPGDALDADPVTLTTIRVSERTRDRLTGLKRGNDTYDDVLVRLLDAQG